MRTEDDDYKQAAYRKTRGELLQKWQAQNMLDPAKVWSKHKGKDKAAMCREAMEKLGWSVHRFDQRMEDWISHERRKAKSVKRRKKKKKKKKRKRKRGDSSSDSSDSTTDSDATDTNDDRPRPAEKNAEAAADTEDARNAGQPRSYNTGERVSLVDDKHRPMCHGFILDDEPKLPTGMHKYGDAHGYMDDCGVGDFKHVRLQAVCR